MENFQEKTVQNMGKWKVFQHFDWMRLVWTLEKLNWPRTFVYTSAQKRLICEVFFVASSVTAEQSAPYSNNFKYVSCPLNLTTSKYNEAYVNILHSRICFELQSSFPATVFHIMYNVQCAKLLYLVSYLISFPFVFLRWCVVAQWQFWPSNSGWYRAVAYR